MGHASCRRSSGTCILAGGAAEGHASLQEEQQKDMHPCRRSSRTCISVGRALGAASLQQEQRDVHWCRRSAGTCIPTRGVAGATLVQNPHPRHRSSRGTRIPAGGAAGHASLQEHRRDPQQHSSTWISTSPHPAAPAAFEHGVPGEARRALQAGPAHAAPHELISALRAAEMSALPIPSRTTRSLRGTELKEGVRILCQFPQQELQM